MINASASSPTAPTPGSTSSVSATTTTVSTPSTPSVPKSVAASSNLQEKINGGKPPVKNEEPITPMRKKSRFNFKMIGLGAILVLVVAALGVGLYLSSTEQDIRQYAACGAWECNSCGCGCSDYFDSRPECRTGGGGGGDDGGGGGSCASGWSCNNNCADSAAVTIFNNTWCDGKARWMQEAGCGGPGSTPKSEGCGGGGGGGDPNVCNGAGTASACSGNAPGSACNGFPGTCQANGTDSSGKTQCGCVAPGSCQTNGGSCYTGSTCNGLNPGRVPVSASSGCSSGQVCCGNPITSPPNACNTASTGGCGGLTPGAECNGGAGLCNGTAGGPCACMPKASITPTSCNANSDSTCIGKNPNTGATCVSGGQSGTCSGSAGGPCVCQVGTGGGNVGVCPTGAATHATAASCTSYCATTSCSCEVDSKGIARCSRQQTDDAACSRYNGNPAACLGVAGGRCSFGGQFCTDTPTGCSSGWSCNTRCASANAVALFSATWVDGKARWLWEDSGNNSSCGGSPSQLKATSSGSECTSYGLDRSLCDRNDDVCRWANDTIGCVARTTTTCASKTNPASCNSTPAGGNQVCRWEGPTTTGTCVDNVGTPAASCVDYRSIPECNSTSDSLACGWNYQINKCESGAGRAPCRPGSCIDGNVCNYDGSIINVRCNATNINCCILGTTRANFSPTSCLSQNGRIGRCEDYPGGGVNPPVAPPQPTPGSCTNNGNQIAKYQKYVCNKCSYYTASDGVAAWRCDTLVQEGTQRLTLNGDECGQVDQIDTAGKYCGYENNVSAYNCNLPRCQGTPPSSPGTSPTPPPSGPQCLNITMTNVTTPGAAAPKMGDAVTFTCGAVPGITNYAFRVVEPSGALVPLQATGRTSASYTITKPGVYKAQCQICTGAAASTCHQFENPNPPVLLN